MKITIDEKVCLKHKITLEELLIVLMVRQVPKSHEVIMNLLAREILVLKNGFYYVTQHWSDVLDEILCDSSGQTDTDETLLQLAEKVRQCFPEGKMKDRFGRPTPYYYRCNRTEVKNALKRFFNNTGLRPSDEDIIDAAKRYVADFKGDYNGKLRLAKYFIWKNDVRPTEDGRAEVEQKSDLLTYLANKDSAEENSEDWTTKLI